MNLPYGQYQNGVRPMFARTAIVIGVLGIVFYAGFVTGSTVLPTLTYTQPIAPALHLDAGLVQSEGMPREPWSYFPDNYKNEGKNEDGNVMTYEHD